MRLIDADELIEQLTPTEDATNNGAKLLLAVFVDAVKAFPTVDAVPVVHGEWIEYGEPNSLGEYESWYWTCSECGTVGLNVFNYCPECGARMDGENDG